MLHVVVCVNSACIVVAERDYKDRRLWKVTLYVF